MKRIVVYIALFSFAFLLFAPAPSRAASRSLSLNDSGSDVLAFQKGLVTLKYLAAKYATSYFGPLTENALKKFQCDQQLTCSGTGYGVYGPETKIAFAAALQAAASPPSLALGSSGSDVLALQKGLATLKYLSSKYATSYFGSLTEAALQKFQCDHNVVCAGAPSTTGYGVYGSGTRIALTAALAASDNPITIDAALTPPAKGPFEFSGWIPYWRAATGTADVAPHLSELTSVMPFAYSVKNDGTLADTAKLGEEPWTSFIAQAKQQKVRVVPTIMWGNGDTIDKLLSITSIRIALEDEVANLVKENGFDGIDIDFEAKKHETISYFSTFLKGLYQRMGATKWVYCTVEARMPIEDRYLPGASIPPDATDFANDYVEMNKYCDRVEIMAYDQGTIDVRLNALRPAPYAPVADPTWVESLVKLAAQTISRNKLIIGVPTYGYEYSVTPLSDGYQYKLLWPFNPGYATDIAGRLGIVPARTSAGEAGFVYNPAILAAVVAGDSTSTVMQQTIAPSSVTQNATSTQAVAAATFNFLSWSDAQAIADKVALAKKLGVRGVAVFKLDGGEDPGIWSVLK